MHLKDRRDAGQRLSKLLEKYQGDEVVVFALPRGGVVVADEIAKSLKAPLDLILAHKIGHPYQPEYAVAAVSESGHLIVSPRERHYIGTDWLTLAKEKEMAEIKRKRAQYLQGRKEISLKGKVAILVDDGIATGLTMQAGILELKDRQPKKIVAAVPVAPEGTANLLKKMVDELVALDIPEDFVFLGAVGAYYRNFSQVEDEEVIDILKTSIQK